MNQLPSYIPQPAWSKWLLVLALLCALGFIAAHYAPQALERISRTDTPPKPSLNLSDADTEYQLQHLDDAIVAQTNAAAALHQSLAWIDRAQSSLDDPLAVRRLQLARSAVHTAEIQINRTVEQLQVTRNLLIERSTHREH